MLLLSDLKCRNRYTIILGCDENPDILVETGLSAAD
jgi:hypothetical protein